MRTLALAARLLPALTIGCGLVVAVDAPRLLHDAGLNGVGGAGPEPDASTEVPPDTAGDANPDRDFASDAPDPVGALGRVPAPDVDAGLGRSDMPSVSTDGQLVVYQSWSSIWLHDRRIGSTTLMSVVPGTQTPLEPSNYQPRIARDGSSVTFISGAPSIVNALPPSVILKRIAFDANRMTSTSRSCSSPVVSDETAVGGPTVAFVTDTAVFPDDVNQKNDVFVTWGAKYLTERVSVGRDDTDANGASDWPSISADGDRVAFESHASNLVAGDVNATRDIFVRFRMAAKTVHASVSGVVSGAAVAEGNGASYEAAISSNGQRVAFTSDASNLVADDHNHVADVFVHDLESGETVRVSVGRGGAEANGASSLPSIDATGRLVAFLSYATNLDPSDVRPTDAGGGQHLFVHDLVTRKTTHISPAIGDERNLNGAEARPAISGNGRVVVFASDLPLLPGGPSSDAGGTIDRVYVYLYEFSTAPWL